jgi:hypothetical protein
VNLERVSIIEGEGSLNRSVFKRLLELSGIQAALPVDLPVRVLVLCF